MQPAFVLPEAVQESLSRWGLVLESDKRLPSVASLVAGEPISGSWWSNPKARGTYEAVQALEERRDVLRVKLVSGKVTFVLDRLWPAVLAAGRAREPWQFSGLSSETLALLGLVEEAGWVRLDQLLGAGPGTRESARELERRLLVHGDEVHAAKGSHTKVLQTWDRWVKAVDCKSEGLAISEAKSTLESLVQTLNSEFGASALLPWQAR